MTREDALALLRRYEGFVPFLDGIAGRFPSDGSERKAMRWLGYAQGAAHALGYYTLDEIKAHSRTGIVHAPSRASGVAKAYDDAGNDLDDPLQGGGMWADGARSALIACRRRMTEILQGES